MEKILGGNESMNFHYTVTTNRTIEEAIVAVEESLQKHKFGVLWKLDVPATLRSKGVDADFTFHVLEVCNPGVAKAFLTENKMAGYFMPCRVVVYEEEGKTHLGLVKPTALMGLVNQELAGKAEEVEKELIAAIDGAI